VTGRGRVLVVDDQEPNRLLLRDMLEALGHDVEVAASGAEALETLPSGIDLVLVDARMPGMDGFELAARLRSVAAAAELPIVMVTALDSRGARLRAVEAGVNDFISKPVDMTELGLRVGSQLQLKQASDALRRHGEELERKVEERTAELRRALEAARAAEERTRAAHLDTIERLVLASEYKDRDTASHIRRVSTLSGLLAGWSGADGEEAELVRRAAPMHDVGKIGIPDTILLKPGSLTGEERAIMQGHTTIGARILEGTPSEILQAGAVIALTHHERWDGEGYPRGLRGEEISPWGRICAIADVFDALTADRPYRKAFTAAEARELMEAERGRHFDPALLDLFLENFTHVVMLRERLTSAQ
jgi:putative two-component system response regulator